MISTDSARSSAEEKHVLVFGVKHRKVQTYAETLQYWLHFYNIRQLLFAKHHQPSPLVSAKIYRRGEVTCLQGPFI